MRPLVCPLVESQLFRHIFKTVMPEVVVHAAHPPGAGQDEQIQQSIVVVVDQRDSAARRLDDELFIGVAAVWKLSRQARLRGNVSEIRPEARAA